MTHIDENNGNDISDATINITVEFDTRFDYKNGVYDEKVGMIYDFDEDKAYDFIQGLINKSYGGGKRKGRKSRTKKTRIHRKKSRKK